MAIRLPTSIDGLGTRPWKKPLLLLLWPSCVARLLLMRYDARRKKTRRAPLSHMHSERLVEPRMHLPELVMERLTTSGDMLEGLRPVPSAAAGRPATPAQAIAAGVGANCASPCAKDSPQATAAVVGVQQSLKQQHHQPKLPYT